LSVDFVHASETVVSVNPVTWLFFGDVGGWVSAAASAGTAAEAAEYPGAE